MKSIKITDKNSKDYDIEINESTLRDISEKDEYEKWEVELDIYDQQGIFGHGFFEIKIESGNKYSEEDILKSLISFGIKSLEKLINEGADICSFRIHCN